MMMGRSSGFTSARGSAINVSDTAFDKAKSLLAIDDNHNEEEPTIIANNDVTMPEKVSNTIEFVNNRGNNINTSFASAKKAHQIFESIDNSTEPEVSKNPAQPISCGFANARGNWINIGNDALLKAKILFDSVDHSNGTVEEPESAINSEVQKSIVNNFVSKCMENFGFSNAHGNAINVSSKALDRAAKLFKHVEDDIEENFDHAEKPQMLNNNYKPSEDDLQVSPEIGDSRSKRRSADLCPRRIFEEDHNHRDHNKILTGTVGADSIAGSSCSKLPEQKPDAIIQRHSSLNEIKLSDAKKRRFTSPLLDKFKSNQHQSRLYITSDSGNSSANTSRSSVAMNVSRGESSTISTTAATEASVPKLADDVSPPTPSVSVIRVSAISADGGAVSAVDVIVVRVYPVQFQEHSINGRVIIRNEKSENAEVAKFERNIEDLMESVRAEMEQRWENEANHTEKIQDFINVSTQIVKHCGDAEELYNLLNRCVDTVKFENALTLSQKKDLQDFISRLQEKKSAEIANQIMKEVKAKGGQLFRKTVPVLKFRVLDLNASTTDLADYAMVTIRNPSDDLIQSVKENAQFRIHDVSSTPFKIIPSKNLQKMCRILTTSAKTKLETLLSSPGVDLKPNLDFLQRRITRFSDLKKLNFSMLFHQIDFVCLIVELKSCPMLDIVFVVDDRLDLLQIKVPEGLKIQKLDDVVVEGQFLAMLNIDVDEGTLNFRVPQAKWTEYSVVTTDPKNPVFAEALQKMKSSVKNKAQYLNESVTKLKSLLGTPRVAYNARNNANKVQAPPHTIACISTTPISRKEAQLRQYENFMRKIELDRKGSMSENRKTSPATLESPEPKLSDFAANSETNILTPSVRRQYKRPRKLL